MADDVVHERLLLVAPSGIEALAAFGVRLADHAPALDAAADPQRRVDVPVVIAAGHGIHPRRPAELAGADDHRFVEHASCRAASRPCGQIVDQAVETFVEPRRKCSSGSTRALRSKMQLW